MPAEKSLIIVESPAKAKTLKKYLGRGYDVKASVGHILDLPKSKLGIDIEKGFEPQYELIAGKQKVVDAIQEAAAHADHIYLAADPDREGEAIAWHVAQILHVPKNKIARVLFHEITKPAVLKALQQPLSLDSNKVESQQARRILDRLVGYKISPLLWTRVRRGLSAGRVQSVAVRLIVEREKEIQAFKPKQYFEILARFIVSEIPIVTKLFRIGKEKLERTALDNADRVSTLMSALQTATWKIASVQTKERRRFPSPPFITSTLQQEAARRLHFSAKKTMMHAQRLYEGAEVGGETTGLITYMRTDSTRVSQDMVEDLRKHIRDTFGKEYVPATPQEFKNKKSAQDAHEAIRPTSLSLDPKSVQADLEPEAFRLFELIWKRFWASQMSPAVFDQTTLELEATDSKGETYGFRVAGSVLRFPGYLKMWQDDDPEASTALPPLTQETPLQKPALKQETHQTEPPPHYNESSLIKLLEEKGIGRPSTYASILSTIQDRQYVEKKENRFYPTELGNLVTELLVQNFEKIVDEQFTAQMEEELDQIEEGKANWKTILKAFYDPFSEMLVAAQEKMRNLKREETPTDLVCPKCGKTVVLKWGRNGRFAACLGYPECRFTSEYTEEGGHIKLVPQVVTDDVCPKCQNPMVQKTGRFGPFLACSRYPECKTTKAITTHIACPDCKEGELAARRTRFGKVFYGCTRYPECKFALWDKPISEKCPQCASPFLVEHTTKKEGTVVQCRSGECGYKRQA